MKAKKDLHDDDLQLLTEKTTDTSIDEEPLPL